MIYITGDMHGEQARFNLLEKECNFSSTDTLIVCGDFGYLFKDNPAEHAFLDNLEQRSYTIYFLDGNHENFPAIFRYPEETWHGGRIHRIRRNVIHLMRGQVFTIENKRFFTMGGAYSIDCYMRKLNFSYWQEELPTQGDYQEAIKNLNQHDNYVDYILTHTCPREVIRMIGYEPNRQDLELTGFLEFLMYEISYTHWYFGHWHIDQNITNKFTAVWFQTIRLSHNDTI